MKLKEMLRHVRMNHRDIYDELEKGGALDDAMRSRIISAAAEAM